MDQNFTKMFLFPSWRQSGRTFCPRTFCPRTFCPGTFCPRKFCPRTYCPRTHCVPCFCSYADDDDEDVVISLTSGDPNISAGRIRYHLFIITLWRHLVYLSFLCKAKNGLQMEPPSPLFCTGHLHRDNDWSPWNWWEHTNHEFKFSWLKGLCHEMNNFWKS
jgi:hypothetical protein